MAPLAKELKAGHAGSAGTELGDPLVKGIKCGNTATWP